MEYTITCRHQTLEDRQLIERMACSRLHVTDMGTHYHASDGVREGCGAGVAEAMEALFESDPERFEGETIVLWRCGESWTYVLESWTYYGSGRYLDDPNLYL